MLIRNKQEKGYHKLLIFNKIKDFVRTTYSLISLLPKIEDFGLSSQMRRAVVSVLSNFVEGYLKTSIKHKLSYMEIANTSLQELEAQAEICLILEYWTHEQYNEFEIKRGEVAYLLSRYTAAIKNL